MDWLSRENREKIGIVDFSNNDEHGSGDANLVGSVRNCIIRDRSLDQKEKDEFRGTRTSLSISMQDCKEMYEKM